MMMKSYSSKIYTWIWWKLSKRWLAHVCRHWTCYEKGWYCSKWPDELYTIEAADKIPDNCKYQLAAIQTAQNQKETNRGGLEKLLKLKTGAKVLLTVNLDIQDRLINDQTGNISHTEFAQGGASRLKGNEIILFRKTKLLGSYWKIWSRDSNKERSNISIR